MFRFSFLSLIYLLSNYSPQYLCLQENYYWRQYTGDVPKDAVVGGQDINHKNIYIGQAYVQNEGLIVAQIFPKIREVYAPINGIKKIQNHIKILCGPYENFYWASANSSKLHLQLIGQHAVIGGHEDGHGVINIGRISYEGETKIGKINSFRTETAAFFFNKNQKEAFVNSYEILLYRENSYDIDARSKTVAASK
ncbi:hypothetical protein TcasGA2_TC031416 [Tribolium castaneum]|uniref:Uncharacterized protein n=1 Tax=Tribolium castaneum TaxID=7070 RepID=A0A139WAP2_TRICA|nr:PREDICTED: uncharacterized protein LOC103314536 [Tribolium castaneum]KYB25002.1 hypothetical protein TcasGA2_TC031416 [Tribolium castaneum]|eukprot:XP_008199117.1 PREDICTED: uncharacterized protein LOC103314536 [Tribolium castaneum]